MTIEALLERIATSLERQAAALEAPMRAINAVQQAGAPPAASEPPKRGPGRPPKSSPATDGRTRSWRWTSAHVPAPSFPSTG